MAGFSSRILGILASAVLVLGLSAGPARATVGEPNWSPALSVDLGTDALASIASVGDYLWVAESWQRGRLFRVNKSNGSYTTHSSGTVGITLQEFQGRLFMTGWEGTNPGSLAELSPMTGQVLNRTTVCPAGRDGPTNFAIDANEIVVACKSGVLTVVSTDGLVTQRTARIGSWLTGSTVHGDEIWIGSYYGSVHVLDRASLAIKTTITGCSEAWNLWSDATTVYCQGLGSVTAYNAASKAPVWTVSTPVSGYGAHRYSDEILVAGYHDGKVGMIDTATGTLAWTHQVTSLRDNLNGAYFDNDSLWVGIGGTLTKFSLSGQPDPGTGADVDAPVLVSVDGPAEVAAGDAVLLRWRLTDATGVGSTTAWIRGPRGNAVPSCGGSAATRSSGTALDGWYSQTCVIPDSAVSGTYTVTYESEDVLGNTSSEAGLTFELTGADADVDAPVLASVDAPAEVVAGDAVLVRWRLTDVSGVSSTTAWIRGPRGSAVPSCGGSAAARSSGTALDGWYSQTCVIPVSAASGRYTVTFESEDIFGNVSSEVGHTLVVTRSTTPVEPPTPSDIYELTQTEASKTSVSIGSRVSFASAVSVLMSDGTYSRAEDGVDATLQVQERGRWVDVKRVQSSGGSVEASARVSASAFYRFKLVDGTVSAPVKVRALANAPDQLVIKWPKRVVSAFKVKVLLRSNNRVWRQPETVVLSIKPSGASNWQTVDYGVTRRGKITLSTKDLKSGTWRVSVSEHGLEDSRVYGSA